jgi:hypothetical protein
MRWEEYPVGGYGLITIDTVLTIPRGSVLLVPVFMADSTSQESS